MGMDGVGRRATNQVGAGSFKDAVTSDEDDEMRCPTCGRRSTGRPRLQVDVQGHHARNSGLSDASTTPSRHEQISQRLEALVRP